jgi:DNA-binding NtrC family response regulator
MALLSTLGGAVHLVVSDIATPEMTGLELASAVRHLWPHVPVLLVSGHGGAGTGCQGLFLAKPFPGEGLLRAVSGLVPTPEGR